MITAKRSMIPVLNRQPPLTWRPLFLDTTHLRKSASFVCSNGHDGALLDHEIASDGTVTPSVVCNGIPDGEGCDFHEMVKLEGWEA